MSTIQTCNDSGASIELHCHAPMCHHHSTLDLIALRDRLGPDHSVMHDDIVQLFKCSKCGSKKVGFIHHVDTRSRLAREGGMEPSPSD